jgi:redox-sensing transcriptional repressor
MSAGIVVVPKACVERLPLYYRALVELEEKGIGVVSSDELASVAGVKAFQLRKDLSYFGEFGIRGFGYDVQGLKTQLREILGISRPWKVGIVGAGRLGTALAEYPGFKYHGLIISAIFDTSPEIIGTCIGESGLIVYPVSQMADIVSTRGIRIGVITVPASSAQSVADILIGAGVKGVWNFAPTKLDVPEGIEVHYEDLSVGLLSLSHYLTRNGSRGD